MLLIHETISPTHGRPVIESSPPGPDYTISTTIATEKKLNFIAKSPSSQGSLATTCPR